MRISALGPDVCSSDLGSELLDGRACRVTKRRVGAAVEQDIRANECAQAAVQVPAIFRIAHELPFWREGQGRTAIIARPPVVVDADDVQHLRIQERKVAAKGKRGSGRVENGGAR